MLAADTNRAPRGFNYRKTGGGIYAFEVLEIVKSKFKPDSQHIYI